MKPLNMWSEVEIKAGIYDRQNEINILQNELRVRASQPVKPVAKKPEVKKEKEQSKKA